jgi:hypothetical protein
MSTIANLRVKLTADSSKLDRAMGKAKFSVQQLGVAVAGVAVAFGAIIKSGLDSADALSKMSIRTGASVEALSVLEHAASLADIEMTSLSRGLFNLNRNLAAAKEGATAPALAFAKLGLSLRELEKMTVEQRFAVLADALTAVTSEAHRAKLGFDIFGGAFRKMSPILAGGSKGLREAAKEAAAIGGILSSEDALGAAEANDSIQRLMNTFSNMARKLGTTVAPMVTKIVDLLGTVLIGAVKSATAIFTGFGESIGAVFTAIKAFVTGDFKIGANILKDMENISARARAAAGIDDIPDVLKGAFKGLDRTTLGNMTESADRKSFGGTGEPLKDLIPETKKQTDELTRMRQILTAGIPAIVT